MDPYVYLQTDIYTVIGCLKQYKRRSRKREEGRIKWIDYRAKISYTQTFSALMIFVSAAHVALFSKNMSGAHVCAHFFER